MKSMSITPEKNTTSTYNHTTRLYFKKCAAYGCQIVQTAAHENQESRHTQPIQKECEAHPTTKYDVQTWRIPASHIWVEAPVGKYTWLGVKLPHCWPNSHTVL